MNTDQPTTTASARQKSRTLDHRILEGANTNSAPKGVRDKTYKYFGVSKAKYEAAQTASARPENDAQELRLTDYCIRHYTDNGQITAYAQWNDGARTEGKPDSAHMHYLRLRAQKEGVQIRSEKW